MKSFKSGTYIQALDYKAFKPESINKSYHFDDKELLPLLEKANLKLGELNAFSELVPDVDHFIRLHVLKEATVSSKIEGTQTNMEEALLQEEEIQPEKRDDWREVNNYIHALNNSVEQLNKLPLSSRLLKTAHKTLLSGVRGKHKLPGDFRKSQNWIGGASIKDAAFIPPVWQDVEPLISDLEKFLHNNDTGLPHVLKAAIAHYQFETIHPFLDGNGRIGRLLITLYFIHAGILQKPVLYLSDFFERNRSHYYDNLTAVRTRHDIRQWLKFFLVGVIETSDKAIAGLKSIIKLKQECETKRITSLGKKMPKAQLLLQHLFTSPVVRPEEVAKITSQSLVSSYKLIENFERLNILKEMTGNQRNRIYIFNEYFDVFK
jgi:Fic family protein